MTERAFLLTTTASYEDCLGTRKALERLLRQLTRQFNLVYHLLEGNCVKLQVDEEDVRRLKKKLMENPLTHGMLVETTPTAGGDRAFPKRPALQKSSDGKVIRVSFGFAGQ